MRIPYAGAMLVLIAIGIASYASDAGSSAVLGWVYASAGEPKPLWTDSGCMCTRCDGWCSGPYNSGSFTCRIIGVFERYDQYGNPRPLSAWVHADCTATCVHLFWSVNPSCTASRDNSGTGRVTVDASCQTPPHSWCAEWANTIKWCDVDSADCDCVEW